MKKNKPTDTIICGVVLLIAAIITAVIGMLPPPELKNANEMTAAEISDEYSYYIEDLTIIDFYMTQTGGDSGNGKYYIASFEDADDKLCLVSVYAKTSADIHDELEAYAADSDAAYGDLVLSGCFTTKEVSSIDDMSTHYDRFADSYGNDILKYMGRSAQDLNLHMEYVCADAADYEDEASNSFMLIVGAVFLVLGTVLLIFGLKAKKKLKEEEEARARFNANQPTDEPDFYRPPQE